MSAATNRRATGSTDPLSLRERTRLAVQGELITVAQRLFVEHGFEATTIDQIAAEAGMSRRSFFRYFPTKEDLILSKYERTGAELANALRNRPADEPLWSSLRAVLDHVVDYASDPDRAASMAVLDRVIASSESLRGAYLGRIDRIQSDLADIVRQRPDYAREFGPDNGPGPRAVVGAAFACLAAATETAARTGADLGVTLDRAMSAVSRLR